MAVNSSLNMDLHSIIPHRFPFLFVDRLLELDPGRRAVGVKNVTINEPFFVGHFPGHPVMPGVLIVEALAQVGAAAVLSLPENKGRLAFFAGIEGFRFRRPVVPGDTLELEVELIRLRGPVGKGRATARVDGETAAEGTLTFALQPAAEPAAGPDSEIDAPSGGSKD